MNEGVVSAAPSPRQRPARATRASESQTTVLPRSSCTVPRACSSRSTRLTVARDVPAISAMSSCVSGTVTSRAAAETPRARRAAAAPACRRRRSAPRRSVCSSVAPARRGGSRAPRSRSGTRAAAGRSPGGAPTASRPPRAPRPSPSGPSPRRSSASSPNASPGPCTAISAVSPSGVVIRTAKRPLTMSWSESAGSP